MSRSAEEYSHLSSLLSEVLDDIGMNGDAVNIKRELMMQFETLNQVYWKLIEDKITVYHFGSQLEGTATHEQKSDVDHVWELEDPIVIKDKKFWQYRQIQFQMIRNKSVTPGYCLLQAMRTDIPLPEQSLKTAITGCLWGIAKAFKAEQGMVLLKNNVIQTSGSYVRNGPAFTIPRNSKTQEIDNVYALKCDQWPDRARIPADEQNPQKWPTMDIKREAELTGCLVVAVPGKESQYEDLEWRISTVKAEKILMFSLNIIQLQCYVLLKIVVKTFIHPKYGKVITSYMCKNVLFHQINRGQQDAWQKHTLFQCLKSCIVELNNCVRHNLLPHFIIPENNLLRGKLTDIEQFQIVQEFENLIEMDIDIIFSIKTDDIGLRFHVKVNQNPNTVSKPKYIYSENVNDLLTKEQIMSNYVLNMRLWLLEISTHIYRDILSCHFDPNSPTLHGILHKCKLLVEHGSTRQKEACKPLIPIIESSIGSIEASTQLANSSSVSEEVFQKWFPDSIKEVNIRSCLKKASILHCCGRSRQAEKILEEVNKYFEADTILTLCLCKDPGISLVQGIMYNKIYTSCMIFLYDEINCIPKQLQYEMYKYSIKDIIKIQGEMDSWKLSIRVDVSHYLYFLQFKIYKHLDKEIEKNHALEKLQKAILSDSHSCHTDTAYNFLGLCLEEENRIDEALQCYFKSFKFMPHNNMAIVHVCKLLCKIIHQKQ